MRARAPTRPGPQPRSGVSGRRDEAAVGREICAGDRCWRSLAENNDDVRDLPRDGGSADGGITGCLFRDRIGVPTVAHATVAATPSSPVRRLWPRGLSLPADAGGQSGRGARSVLWDGQRRTVPPSMLIT